MNQTPFAAALIAASIAIASASALTVSYDNASLNTGNGLASSVPALRLTSRTDLPGAYALDLSVAQGGREAATYTNASLEFSGNLPLGRGFIQPGLVVGYTRIDYSGSYFHDGPGWRMASAYAGAHIGYRRQIAPGVRIDAGISFGHNFATQYSGIHTIGGLYEAADAGASLRFGPGDLTVGARLMNLPISESHGLHIRTAEYLIGYRMTF